MKIQCFPEVLHISADSQTIFTHVFQVLSIFSTEETYKKSRQFWSVIGYSSKQVDKIADRTRNSRKNMCGLSLTFLYIYPSLRSKGCKSTTRYHKLLEWQGIESVALLVKPLNYFKKKLPYLFLVLFSLSPFFLQQKRQVTYDLRSLTCKQKQVKCISNFFWKQ